jgi:hypothetical protein
LSELSEDWLYSYRELIEFGFSITSFDSLSLDLIVNTDFYDG